MRSILSVSIAGALLVGAGSVVAMRSADQSAIAGVAAGPIARVPAPALDPAEAGKTATAVFAGGCFWGVQGVFQHVKGVTQAVSGYSGGRKSAADYETVSGGDTGHAESVRITYDPAQVSYGTLLRIFFAVAADPTTLNRQGPDSGTQYRTAIFPTTPEQARVAAAYIAQLRTAKVWSRPIVTRVERLTGFYPAEDYHQDYLSRKPDYPYIRINDLPKVAALRQAFPARYRETPVLVNEKG